MTFDETHAYAPPARRFMLTGKVNAETDNFEHRNFSAAVPLIPPIILGSIGKLFGSLGLAFIVADCLFPPALFLLLYFIASPVVQQRDLKLLVVWSSTLIPFGVLNTIWMGEDALVTPLEITRTPQPEISFLVLMISVVLLARAIQEQSSWRWTLAAGVSAGAVVYSYYFYALSWGITLALMLVLGLSCKSRPIWSRTALTIAIMLALVVPYTLASLRGTTQAGQTFLLERMGAYTHSPDLLPLICALLLTVLVFTFGKKYCRTYTTYLILTVLVAASLFGMNFQILSGYETQRWHFWKRLALPVCFFILASAVAYFASKSRQVDRWRVAARLLLFLLIIDTAARLIYVGIRVAPYHRATNPDIAMLNWIRVHLPSGQVIGTADPKLILLIPALTADYTYVPSGLRSLTSTGEIVSRYFEIAYLLHISPSEFADLAAIPNHLGHSTELLQVLGLSYTGDPTVYKDLLNQYNAAYQKCPFPRGRLDYLVLPASDQAVAQRFPLARVTYSNSAYRLLDLKGGA